MILSARKEILSIPTASGHASCIARVNGETWLVWFGGTWEGDPDVKIYLSRNAGSGWTEPMRICADEALPHWNPVLLPSGEGADLFFKVGSTIPGWRTLRVRLNRHGQPVSDPTEVVPGDEGGRGPVRSKCIRLADGRVLAPGSIETPEPTRWSEYPGRAYLSYLPENDPALRWKPFVDISEDSGATFSRMAPVPLMKDDGSASAPCNDTPLGGRGIEPCRVKNAGAIQPVLWQSADGHVHMLLRSSEGWILRSDSPDGERWSVAERTSMPNNNSGIELMPMENGDLLLCMNPVAGDWAERTPLWLCLSKDGGDTFSPILAPEIAPGEYSYPSIACENGVIYLSYTWNRKTIAVWVIETER